MFWFFAIPMLIIGGLLVIELLILSYEAIAEAVRKYKEEKNYKEIVAAKIKKIYKKDNYNCVNVGLLDRRNKEHEEIVLRAEEDANDYRVGQRIRLT